VEAYDILRTIIILVSYLCLAMIQLSRVYHYIRGEAIIKLYVIFNILEVGGVPHWPFYVLGWYRRLIRRKVPLPACTR
jgi:hypothetical protein